MCKCQPQIHWYDRYLNVGEMCFIPTNLHNEQFNGVRQLRWQHLSPVVSTCSTSNMLLSSFLINTVSFLPLSLFLWYPSRFVISGLSLLFGDVDGFFLQSKGFFAVKHIHYPVNPSSDPFHTDAVVPSSDYYRTKRVLPPSDHHCIVRVAPSGDHYCIHIAMSSSDHCCTGTVPPSSDHQEPMKVAPSSQIKSNQVLFSHTYNLQYVHFIKSDVM